MINKSTSQQEMTAAEIVSSKSVHATPMQLWAARVGLVEKTTAEGGKMEGSAGSLGRVVNMIKIDCAQDTLSKNI